MKVFAAFNIKGGVGKTATAVNLAYVSARRGERTLLWDLDPQGAASYYFRIRPRVKGGTRRLIARGADLAEFVRGSDYDDLDVLPADFSHRDMDLALERSKRPARRLARLLEPLAEQYDCVYLDCPPSISLVSEAIFGAADALLIPTIPTPLSLRTLAQLMKHLKHRRRAEHGAAPLALPFFCMVDRRKTIHRRTCQWTQEQRLGFLATEIPYSSVVEQMGVRRAPVGAFAPSSPAARAYEALAAEFTERVREGRRAHSPSRKAVRGVLRALIDDGGRDATLVPAPPPRANHAVQPDRRPNQADARCPGGADEDAERREVEFKLRVDDARDFDALASTLGTTTSAAHAIAQVNHFYDTPTRALRRNGLVLRLREAEGHYVLTAKGPGETVSSDGVLTSKAEEEVEVDEAAARALLLGEASPLERLRAGLGTRSPALIRALERTVGDEPLRRLGSFRNERRHFGPLPWSVGRETIELQLEMDRTEFPGHRVHYEVEMEVAPGGEHLGKQALESLFQRAGVGWRSAPSKAERFFSALEGKPI